MPIWKAIRNWSEQVEDDLKNNLAMSKQANTLNYNGMYAGDFSHGQSIGIEKLRWKERKQKYKNEAGKYKYQRLKI